MALLKRAHYCSIWLVYFITASFGLENMIRTNEEEQGQGIVLVPDKNLVLHCNTTDSQDLELEWYKSGVQVNMSDTRIQKFSGNNTLVIYKATEKDTGSYMCVANVGDAVINATIDVRTEVVVEPFHKSLNLVQGDKLTLLCKVKGVPIPKLQWLKDDQPVNISDSRVSFHPDEKGVPNAKLVIEEVDFEDRADYTCFADNGFNSANRTILVRVKDKYAALWPFLGICSEVAILCTIIFVYEKKRQKPDFDESDTDHNPESKNVPDQEEKVQDVRQRK